MTTVPLTGWPLLFRNAFRLSTNPMVLLTSDHVIVDINDACARTFVRPREEVVGREADPLIAVSSRRQLAQVWATLARDGRVTSKLDWTRGDGQIVQVQFAAIPARASGHRLVLCVVLETRQRPLESGERQGAVGSALTPRELEVVSRIAMGRRVHEIAEELHISSATARTHARNAMGKLGARSQAQLVAIVIADGLLDPNVGRST